MGEERAGRGSSMRMISGREIQNADLDLHLAFPEAVYKILYLSTGKWVWKPSYLPGDGSNAKTGGSQESKVWEAGERGTGSRRF